MTYHPPHIGLCATCMHARAVPHPRGGAPYWMCGRAADDPSFPRYPRLPVGQCRGHEAAASANPE